MNFQIGQLTFTTKVAFYLPQKWMRVNSAATATSCGVVWPTPPPQRAAPTGQTPKWLTDGTFANWLVVLTKMVAATTKGDNFVAVSTRSDRPKGATSHQQAAETSNGPKTVLAPSQFSWLRSFSIWPINICILHVVLCCCCCCCYRWCRVHLPTLITLRPKTKE